MNDFEKELKETLKTKCDIGISKDDARRKEIEKMIFQKYTSDMNKAKIITWIFLILCLGMMGVAYVGLKNASETKPSSGVEELTASIFYHLQNQTKSDGKLKKISRYSNRAAVMFSTTYTISRSEYHQKIFSQCTKQLMNTAFTNSKMFHIPAE